MKTRIRITKEGSPCFDEFTRWAIESLGYEDWQMIVIAHASLNEYVKAFAIKDSVDPTILHHRVASLSNK